MDEPLPNPPEAVVGLQRIDLGLMSNNHNWGTLPEMRPSFQENVCMNAAPRCDLARFKAVTTKKKQDGLDLWSALCQCQTLFRVPDTLRCDRTFAVNDDETYYLDAMDTWLNAVPGEIGMEDIPLVNGAFTRRIMHAFGKRGEFFKELSERRRTGLWLPVDHKENMFYSDVELNELYPVVETWVQELAQPPALPVPVSFVVRYYHTELRQAQKRRLLGLPLSERQRRLLFCLEHEHYVVCLIMWWSEAFHGGRHFVLPKSAVDKLEAKCGQLILEGVKLVQVILEYMRSATTRSSTVHFWLAFANNRMEESTCVHAKRHSGEYDPDGRPLRKRLFVEEKNGKVLLTAHSMKLYKRNTALNKKLTDPDLDKIPGLLNVVREQNWNLHGDLRVGDVIANLLRLYNATSSILQSVTRQGIAPGHAVINPREDRYARFEPPLPRVGYHNDGHEEERYYNNGVQEGRYYNDGHGQGHEYRGGHPQHRRYSDGHHEGRYYSDSHRPGRHYSDGNPRGHYYNDSYRYGENNDRIRSRYNPPAPPRRYDNRGDYRDLDGEAVHDNNEHYREAAYNPAPRVDPPYPAEQVIEISDDTVNNNFRGDPGAGPSQQPPPTPPRADSPSQPLPSTSQDAPLHSVNVPPVQKLPDPPGVQPGTWSERLFEAARKDASSNQGPATTLRPSTPFLKPSRSNTPNKQVNHAGENNRQPDQAGASGGDNATATVANGGDNATASVANANGDAVDGALHSDFTKQRSGNVGWCLAEKRTGKHGRDESVENNTEDRTMEDASRPRGSKTPRTETGDANPVDENDPGLMQD